MAVCISPAGHAAAQSSAQAGAVEGQVVVVASTGSAYVPGALVSLDGPEHFATQTNSGGEYNFPSVGPGTYIIRATAPSLETQQSVSVAPGQVADVPLTLQITRTTADVTVTANVTGVTTTIEQKTIENAPNANERFETLLPLIPGVVRGPDGRVNMKGARSAQSGALVNSANVTDPAQKGRSLYDAPNRFLFWSDIHGPWKLNILPVYDVHTGFPYSVQNELREYVGPRSSQRFPQFSSADVQITRQFTVHFGDKGLKLPPAVQSSMSSITTIHAMSKTFAKVPILVLSTTMRGWREFRGKLVFEF